jgi:hypothetical protein
MDPCVFVLCQDGQRAGDRWIPDPKDRNPARQLQSCNKIFFSTKQYFGVMRGLDRSFGAGRGLTQPTPPMTPCEGLFSAACL